MNLCENFRSSRSARIRMLLDPDDVAFRHRARGGDVHRLAGQASLTKEISRAQDGDDSLLALLRHYGDLDLALFDVEDRIGGISLAEVGLPRLMFLDNLTFPGSGEDRGWIQFLSFPTPHRSIPYPGQPTWEPNMRTAKQVLN